MKKGKKEIKEEFSKQTKEQENAHDKELKRILIILGVGIVIIIAVFLSVNSSRNFEYKGVKFKVFEDNKITFYHTEFPIYSSITGMNIANSYFNLRKDPRKLKKIPFDGKINLDVPIKKIILDSSYNEICEGDSNIAIANFAISFSRMGIGVERGNENITCDSLGRYIFVKIEPGDETKIEQTDDTCYNLIVNNCEILDVTEKFMVEALSEFDGKIYAGK